MNQLLRRLSDPRLRPVWIAILIALALLMRLPFLGQAGFDDQFFRSWGAKLDLVGLGNVYLPPNTPNYPPFYLYLLTPLTWISTHLLHAAPETSQAFIAVQKFFNVLVDCADGLLILAILRVRLSFPASYLLAALFLLNPYIAYDSAVWGQVDGLLSLFMLLSLWAAQRNRPIAAALAAAMGILTKAQFVIFMPLLGLYLVRRFGWKRTGEAALWAASLAMAVLLPFALTGSLAILYKEAYGSAAGYFPYLSLNAHNLWWLWVDPSNIFTNASDSTPLFLGLSAKTIGMLLFLAAYLIPVRFLLRDRRPQIADLALAAGLAYLAFYGLNTEMHERYLYPFFALWVVGYRNSWLWWSPYLILSATQLLSLMMMIPFVPGDYWVRTSLYPQATYPMAYANLGTLLFLAIVQATEPVTSAD